MKPVIFIVVILCLSSCYKQKCTDPGIYFEFENYDSTALAVMKLKKYEQGSNFSKLLAEKTGNIYLKSDTADTLTYSHFCWKVETNCDYIIEVPATGQTFKITNFSVQQEKDQLSVMEVADACSNTIHYYINDTAKSLRGMSQSSDYPGSVQVLLSR